MQDRVLPRAQEVPESWTLSVDTCIEKNAYFFILNLLLRFLDFFFFFFARTSINTIPARNLENRGETGVLPESSTRT